MTIDQLAHEKDQAQAALQSLKLAFAREELSETTQAKYGSLCKSHKDIFAPSHQNGKLSHLRDLNEQTHKAMEELQATIGGKNVDLVKISNDFHR